MNSSAAADVELRQRIRQRQIVVEFEQRALETGDLDQANHDASASMVETLDNRGRSHTGIGLALYERLVERRGEETGGKTESSEGDLLSHATSDTGTVQ